MSWNDAAIYIADHAKPAGLLPIAMEHLGRTAIVGHRQRTAQGQAFEAALQALPEAAAMAISSDGDRWGLIMQPGDDEPEAMLFDVLDAAVAALGIDAAAIPAITNHYSDPTFQLDIYRRIAGERSPAQLPLN